MIKIGEIARITGLSIQTIRYYEKEGLICPVEVDRWTGYRYYDEQSIDRLSEIIYLKDLGFSLKQIKNFNEQTIKEKVKDIQNNIAKLRQNLISISSIAKSKGDFKMKKFVNDEDVIGKYQKIGVVAKIEDFENSQMLDENIFNFDEIYFLPNGANYWVFSWTKGILYLNDRELPYKLIGDKLFIGVRDYKTDNVDCYAVYKKIDNKKYDIKEIRIKDDTNLPYIQDDRVVGFWEVYDFIGNPNKFNPKRKEWKYDLWLDEYVFKPNGKVLTKAKNSEDFATLDYSKGYIINKKASTVSEYIVEEIDGKTYLIVEWKSGDYIYGGKVNRYYVFVKTK